MKYIKEEELQRELFISKRNNELTSEGLEIFMKMAELRSHSYNFIDEEIRKESILFAVLSCYKYWRKYDHNKGRGFVFFSVIISHAFIRISKKEELKERIKI